MTYHLKNILFLGKEYSVLCQNENGPCPLLAICNVMILQGRLKLPKDYLSINLELLVNMLSDHLIESTNLSLRRQGNKSTDEASYYMAQRHVQIDTVLGLIPRLQYGLDVNVRFSAVSAFEFTEELNAFDALGIGLYHGWLVDPQDLITKQAIGSKSYNEIMNVLVEYKSRTVQPTSSASIQTYLNEDNSITSKNVDDKTMPDQCDSGPLLSSPDLGNRESQNHCSGLLSEAPILETFLRDTASQLTYFGLLALYATVKERELCVFFRNNHFSTMFLKDGRLYLLVTDAGYADEPEVVWELLDEIDGNTEYVNGYFTAPQVSSEPGAISLALPCPSFSSAHLPPPPLVDPDMLLALQISQEEDARAQSHSQSSRQQFIADNSRKNHQSVRDNIGMNLTMGGGEGTVAMPPVPSASDIDIDSYRQTLTASELETLRREEEYYSQRRKDQRGSSQSSSAAAGDSRRGRVEQAPIQTQRTKTKPKSPCIIC